MNHSHSRLICSMTLAVALAYTSSSLADNSFVTGPYIPKVERDRAVIAFELSEPATATVVIADGAGDRTFTSQEVDTLHFVTIDGLSPGKAFDYTISVTGAKLGEQAQGQLRTACLPGESFSFAVYGDTRPGENQVTIHHAALMQQISLFEPAFSLVLGDMVDDGTVADDWRRFFDVEKEVLRNTAIFPVPGDNDYMEGKGLLTRYFPDLEKGYYSFEWGGVYFFGLKAWDTRGQQPESEFNNKSAQYQWLERELEKKAVQDAPFRIVFLHDPVFISRGRSSNLLRQTFAPLFEKHRVDLVFASWHLFERSRVKGVNYVISGGGGAELIWARPTPGLKALAEAKRHHFCRVDIGAYGLSLRAIAEDGTVLDQVTLSTSLGSSSADQEFSRYATRMASRNICGSNQATAVPVYVFNDRDDHRSVNASLCKTAQSLDVTLEVYNYNLQKNSSLDLLLHAQTASNQEAGSLPAIFVGNNLLEDLGEAPKVLRRVSKKPVPVLFKKQLDLTNTRKATFGSVTAIGVMMSGLYLNLSVGGLLGFLLFGVFLLWVAKRGSSVLRVGLFTLGALFLVGMIWGLFNFSLAKFVPIPDSFVKLLDPLANSHLFFIIQGMLKEPSFRGSGLLYLALRTFSSLAPAFFVILGIKQFVRKKK